MNIKNLLVELGLIMENGVNGLRYQLVRLIIGK